MNEKLAVLTAFEKVVSTELKDMKADMRDEMQTLYVEHGVSQKLLEIGGEKVGTVSFTPSKTVPEIDPFEWRSAMEWMEENGLAELQPVKGWDAHFEKVGDSYVHKASGEVIPWLMDGTKGGVSTVRLSVKPLEVLEKAAPMLDGGIAGLLGGGDV